MPECYSCVKRRIAARDKANEKARLNTIYFVPKVSEKTENPESIDPQATTNPS